MTEKTVALENLDIEHYPFKFKKAQEMVNRDIEKEMVFEDERHLLPFWERVRLYYLELGGECIDGRRC